MIKLINYLCTLSLIVSISACTNTNVSATTAETKTDSIAINDTLNVEGIQLVDESNLNKLTPDPSQFCYLTSNYYDYKDSIELIYPTIQKRKWTALVYDINQQKFYLEPASLDTINWYDDCNAYDMTTIVNKNLLKSEEEESPNKIEYIYLSALNHPIGEVKSFFHAQRTIIPGEPYKFEFNGKLYTLRAEGEKSGSSTMFGESTYEKDPLGRIYNDGEAYCNYQLYLESEGVVQLLNSDCYDHMSLLIYFIGDLDGDSKPDFLFQTNTWYEGNEVTLYLSSKAGSEELVKNMGASGSYFAC